jgi:16S rRNA (adenine1518-N6/adenine1519-N6)-dimethyltransferase
MKKTAAKLGQHFLIHGWAARALAHAAAPQEGETILEIGPGKGILTKELLTLGPVVAVEKDEALVAKLHEIFPQELASERLKIFSADVRDVTPESVGLTKYVVAANIPYYITGEIIRQFLTALTQPRAMALLIQKEVAQRIVSEKGSILSIAVRAFGTPKLVEKVPRKHFSPPPSVDSAILLIDAINRDFFGGLDEAHFFHVVRAGFASKRKFLANNLGVVFDKDAVRASFERASISEKARAEDLSLAQWKALALALK